MKIKFERENKKPNEEEQRKERLEDKKKKELEGLEGVMGILLPMTVRILIEKVEDIEKELKKINARLDKLEGDKNNG